MTTHPTHLRVTGPSVLVRGGAVTYVLSWVVGLTLAPSGPAPTDTAATDRGYYLTHATAVILQSLLIHGLAGLCLLVLAYALPHSLRHRSFTSAIRYARPMRVSGTGAAAVSLAQAAFALTAVRTARSHPALSSQHWLAAINHADTVKLVLLAGFVAAVSASVSSRWRRGVAVALVPLLVLGGAAFVIDDSGVTPALTSALTLSLLLLLVWAGSLAFLRRPDAISPGRV